MLVSVFMALLACSPGGSAEAPESVMRPGVRSPDLPRPRDGDVAIRQELETARRVGTIEAYDLFIARHPGHPLVGEAGRERVELLRRRSRSTDG